MSDHLLADLDDVMACLEQLTQIDRILDELPLPLIKFNPELVWDRHRHIRALLSEARAAALDSLAVARVRIREDLTAALARHQRNGEAATLPARVADVEAQVAALTAELAELRRESSADTPAPPIRLIRKEAES